MEEIDIKPFEIPIKDETDEKEECETVSENPQKLSDVLVVQIILCIFVAIVFVVFKIFQPQSAESFADRLKIITNSPTEEFIGFLYSKIIGLLR